jgi:hypothetical protein
VQPDQRLWRWTAFTASLRFCHISSPLQDYVKCISYPIYSQLKKIAVAGLPRLSFRHNPRALVNWALP